MYKVMLVDDDYPVLEYLSETIPWDQLQFTLQGTYDNGLTAFEQAKIEMPDVLITDIGMPQLNGLELINALKTMNAKLAVVILSCHDEFDFAQRAVKLNVTDYVLKETMEPDYIIDVLNTIRNQLDNEKQRERLADENKATLMKNFLRSTLNYPMLDTSKWMMTARQFGLDATGRTYQVAFCQIDHFQAVKRRFVSADALAFAVRNVIDEILERQLGAICFEYAADKYFLFFPRESSPKHIAYQRIHSILKEVMHALEQNLNVKASFIIGEAGQQPTQLKRTMLHVMNYANHRFYFQDRIQTISAITGYSTKDLFTHYVQALEEFRRIVIAESTQEIVPTVSRWIERIREEHYHPEVVKEWFLKLLLDIQIKFKSSHHYQSTYSVEILHRTIYEMTTLEELEALIKTFLKETISLIGMIHERPKRTEVLEAQRYVALNLHKKLTLNEMAQVLHLNPSYFSRLFKKETGENFIEYVTRMKMERAKQYLRESPKTITEIASLLGYHNKSYFLKLFKNYTGMTPTEYSGVHVTE